MKKIILTSLFLAALLQGNATSYTISEVMNLPGPSDVNRNAPPFKTDRAMQAGENSQKEPSCCSEKCSHSAILETRASYFRPFSKTLRKMFHNGGADYALVVSAPVWEGLNIWGAVDYFSRHGKMINFDASTHITIVPVTLGLKYIYSIYRHFGVYGGIGFRYFFVEGINRSTVLNKTIHRSGLGGVIELGGLFCVNKHLVFGIFGSCSFKKLHGPGHHRAHIIPESLQVGGWNIGGGIGYQF